MMTRAARPFGAAPGPAGPMWADDCRPGSAGTRRVPRGPSASHRHIDPAEYYAARAAGLLPHTAAPAAAATTTVSARRDRRRHAVPQFALLGSSAAKEVSAEQGRALSGTATADSRPLRRAVERDGRPQRPTTVASGSARGTRVRRPPSGVGGVRRGRDGAAWVGPTLRTPHDGAVVASDEEPAKAAAGRPRLGSMEAGVRGVPHRRGKGRVGARKRNHMGATAVASATATPLTGEGSAVAHALIEEGIQRARARCVDHPAAPNAPPRPTPRRIQRPGGLDG
eukprot:COSAG01_NODE_11764_length_1863_cov_2.842971_2_plen_282_part_00